MALFLLDEAEYETLNVAACAMEHAVEVANIQPE